MAAGPDPLTSKRLDSWKEIAAFFTRSERTVKRWEAERGLPVRRVPGKGRRAVFAYSNELADWLKDRPGLEAEAYDSSRDRPRTKSEGSKVVPRALARSLASLTNDGVSSRITAWLLPLALVASVVIFVGSDGQHLKAFSHRHVPNSEAQDLYLKGRYFWNRRTPDDLNKGVDYFMQAIVQDPDDARAYVGLADCYNLLREFGAMPPVEAYPRALSAARRAVELDDNSAEAHASLAFVTYWWSWQGLTAEREFKRALELDPSLVRAHH